MSGGYSPPMSPNKHVENLLLDIMGDLHKEAALTKDSEIHIVVFCMQIVAGTNYWLKLRIIPKQGEPGYAFIKIFESLPQAGVKNPQLMKVIVQPQPSNKFPPTD